MRLRSGLVVYRLRKMYGASLESFQRLSSQLQCQNPVAKKKSWPSIVRSMRTSFIVRVHQGKVQTLKFMHKYFQDIWRHRCVARRHHLFGQFWGLTRIRKFRPEMSFHSVSLHSLAPTCPHTFADASQKQPSGLSSWDRPQRDWWTEQLKSTYNRWAREAMRSSPSPTPTEHGQKRLNSTPRYNTRSVKRLRCEWATTVLRIYNSRPPSMRFSHFWQIFDFLLASNWINADFFVH